MTVRGKRKAAMLLMSLDATAASELLKGYSPQTIQEIAMELSQLDAMKVESAETLNVTKEFCDELQQSRSRGLNVKSFVGDLLKNTVGKEKADEAREKMQQALRDKDPFIALSSAKPAQIAAALENEPPQAIALILSALPPNISTEVLGRFDEETGNMIVWRMAKPGDVSPKTLRRIGEMVCKRLMEITSEEGGAIQEVMPKETLRKVALILSGLTKEKRDTMLDEISGKSESTAKTIKALMVTWEDIVKIEDKSLQEALRKVDAGVMAKALYNADPTVESKIRSNISERAGEMVDEEMALMSEPRKKEVAEAREEVAKPLREANEAEELTFVEED